MSPISHSPHHENSENIGTIEQAALTELLSVRDITNDQQALLAARITQIKKTALSEALKKIDPTLKSTPEALSEALKKIAKPSKENLTKLNALAKLVNMEFIIANGKYATQVQQTEHEKNRENPTYQAQNIFNVLKMNHADAIDTTDLKTKLIVKSIQKIQEIKDESFDLGFINRNTASQKKIPLVIPQSIRDYFELRNSESFFDIPSIKTALKNKEVKQQDFDQLKTRTPITEAIVTKDKSKIPRWAYDKIDVVNAYKIALMSGKFRGKFSDFYDNAYSEKSDISGFMGVSSSGLDKLMYFIGKLFASLGGKNRELPKHPWDKAKEVKKKNSAIEDATKIAKKEKLTISSDDIDPEIAKIINEKNPKIMRVMKWNLQPSTIKSLNANKDKWEIKEKGADGRELHIVNKETGETLYIKGHSEGENSLSIALLALDKQKEDFQDIDNWELSSKILAKLEEKKGLWKIASPQIPDLKHRIINAKTGEVLYTKGDENEDGLMTALEALKPLSSEQKQAIQSVQGVFEGLSEADILEAGFENNEQISLQPALQSFVQLYKDYSDEQKWNSDPLSGDDFKTFITALDQGRFDNDEDAFHRNTHFLGKIKMKDGFFEVDSSKIWDENFNSPREFIDSLRTQKEKHTNSSLRQAQIKAMSPNMSPDKQIKNPRENLST